MNNRLNLKHFESLEKYCVNPIIIIITYLMTNIYLLHKQPSAKVDLGLLKVQFAFREQTFIHVHEFNPKH